jgi:hypothetical protein
MPDVPQFDSVSAEIDAQVKSLPGWQSPVFARVRELIKQADTEVLEEIKWRKPSNGMRGVPTWSHNGLICTGENYKDKLKFTFAKGAALDDPSRLFNASLGGNARRAIDIFEGDKLNESAFKTLIQSAVALNLS